MAIKSPFPPLPTGNSGNDPQEGVATVEIPVYRASDDDADAPVDISRMDTAVLVRPEEMSSILYWFPLWADQHEREARECERKARALGPRQAMWEGTQITLCERRDQIESWSRRGMREQAELRRLRQQIRELEADIRATHDERVKLQIEAREHRAAAVQLRAQVEREAREGEHTWSRGFARGMGGLG